MKKQPLSIALAENLKYLLTTHSSINTQSKLAERAKIGQSSISRILRADTQATADTIETIANAFGITASQLIAPRIDSSNVNPAPLGTRRIPVISYVRAGRWTEVIDNELDDCDSLLTDLELSDMSFALEIAGDSMQPDFNPGDRVIIDPAITPRPGDFVVASNGSNEATFKKYRPRGINENGEQVFELVPLNDDYETIRSDYAPVVIIGVMVEHRRYRKKL